MGMIYRFGENTPQIDPSVFVAPGSHVIGNVTLGARSSVWFGSVLRGDVMPIHVGERTNIQDISMVHVTEGMYETRIGDDVTIGHRAMIHGCTIGDRVLVGMGATILDGAEIGDDCIIGAGALILQRTKIPPRSFVVGAPAVIKREVQEHEVQRILMSAIHYAELAQEYAEGKCELLVPKPTP